MVTDADLVTAFVDGGQRDALAAIYDRHATAVHDTAVAMTRDRSDAEDLTHDVFLTAAERMGQLRDRTKLRPWLFAILRHAVYARSKSQAHTTAVDPTGDDMDHHFSPGPAATQPDEVVDQLAGEDLAVDIRAAARGLDERDQLVLELVARQNLSGDDLAAALGVSLDQSYVIVSRMRDRVERSLGAFIVARTGRRRCVELAELLAGWDGEFTVLLRKRVARHIERCDVCDDTRRRTAVLPLVSLAPAALLPAALRERVLADVALIGGSSDGGSRDRRGRGDSSADAASPLAPPQPAATPPTPTAQAGSKPSARASRVAQRRRGLAYAASLVLVLGAGFGLLRALGREPVSRSAAVTAPSLVAPIGTPTSTTRATTAISSTTVTPTTVAPVAPPEPVPSVVPPVETPTDPAAEPTSPDLGPTTTSPLGRPGDFVIAPAVDDEAPRVTVLTTPITATCRGLDRLTVRAAVADASPIERVELAWIGPGAPGRMAMTRAADGTWTARPALDRVNGDWVMSVVATDAAGNDGSDDAVVAVTGCP